MNTWTNHTIGVAQHREYEQRYGSGDHSSQSAPDRRFRLLPSLLSLLSSLNPF